MSQTTLVRTPRGALSPGHAVAEDSGVCFFCGTHHGRRCAELADIERRIDVAYVRLFGPPRAPRPMTVGRSRP